MVRTTNRSALSPHPAPFLVFYSCLVPFHVLLWDIMRVHYWPQLIAHSCCSKKRVPFSPADVNYHLFNLAKRGQSGGPGHRALTVELLKFTLDFYEPKWQSMTSRKSTSSRQPLWDAELYDCHKAQMERQKTQVMQKQICLQMYLLTASWQDLLFTILCKESVQPTARNTHTLSWTWKPERMMIG